MKIHTSDKVIVKSASINITLDNEEEIKAFKNLLDAAERRLTETSYRLGSDIDPISKLAIGMVHGLIQQVLE